MVKLRIKRIQQYRTCYLGATDLLRNATFFLSPDLAARHAGVDRQNFSDDGSWRVMLSYVFGCRDISRHYYALVALRAEFHQNLHHHFSHNFGPVMSREQITGSTENR